MAKYKRYRNYNRRSRARWAPNIKTFPIQTIEVLPSATFFSTEILATNPIQSENTVSQTYTVKNVEVNFVIESTSALGNVENLTAYIMYVPQGMTIDSNYDINHPEYILNYKFIGSPSPDGQQNYQPFKVRTRLARRLQTGDNIILYVKGYNVGTSSATIEFHGLVRWWTKAN